ncbi:DUF2283 domain-containing protein [Patescibacteria group bacterium]|nr:DUF2283 domain-containing protein [Patescibacteria group bacterium]
MKSHIKYDKNSNILSIRLSKKKSVDSEIQGNVVIDFGEDGKIVNIEIMKINLNEFIQAKNLSPFSLRELIKI